MKFNRFALAIVPAASVISSTAMAQTTGDDYSTILSGLSTGNAVTAIIAAAALLALVGFAKWVAKKVGRFFG